MAGRRRTPATGRWATPLPLQAFTALGVLDLVDVFLGDPQPEDVIYGALPDAWDTDDPPHQACKALGPNNAPYEGDLGDVVHRSTFSAWATDDLPPQDTRGMQRQRLLPIRLWPQPPPKPFHPSRSWK